MIECRNRKSGFTIIELLVVTALIALLAGTTAGVYFSKSKNRAVVGTAKSLLVAVRYARSMAIEQNKDIRLTIDSQEQKFWLATMVEDQEVMVNNQFSRPIALADGLRFETVKIAGNTPDDQDEEDEPQPDEIVFTSAGTASDAIIVIGNGKLACTLTISAATGKAKLCKGLIVEPKKMTVDLDMQEWN